VDWDEVAAQARREFLREQEQATYGGQQPSSDRLAGAAEGWDAAMQFVLRTAMKKLLATGE